MMETTTSGMQNAATTGDRRPPELREILTWARDLISNPLNFTTGAWGRTPAGEFVGSNDARAVCWCSEGAIRKATYALGGDWRDVDAAERAVARALGAGDYEPLSSVSDTSEHRVVIAAFDKAISEAA